MHFPSGHLAEHPLPPGICGALSLGGYQLLVDIGGVGAGRLGSHVFLLLAPDPEPAAPEPGTQIALHQPRLRAESDLAAFVQLAANLGYLRLSGYRLVPERTGLRSRIAVVNPASGAIVLQIPDRHPGRFLGGDGTAAALLARARSLPAAGPPPDLQDPELLRQVLLALALRDEELGGAEAAELTDRALAIGQRDPALDPVALLEAARNGG